jgi:hypothetical protein
MMIVGEHREDFLAHEERRLAVRELLLAFGHRGARAAETL